MDVELGNCDDNKLKSDVSVFLDIQYKIPNGMVISLSESLLLAAVNC